MHTHILLGCAFDLSCDHNAGGLLLAPYGNLIVENYQTNYLHLPGVFRLSIDDWSDVGSGSEEALNEASARLTAFVVRVSDAELESDTYFMLVSAKDSGKITFEGQCFV